MLELELFEDSGKICAINYVIFKPLDLENSISSSFDFDSKSNKENLTKFVEGLNNFLAQHSFNNNDLFTIISAEALEILKRIFKQNLINVPKYLNKNLFIMDKNDLELLDADLNEKAKLFTLEFINNQQKFNSIKLIRD